MAETLSNLVAAMSLADDSPEKMRPLFNSCVQIDHQVQSLLKNNLGRQEAKVLEALKPLRDQVKGFAGTVDFTEIAALAKRYADQVVQRAVASIEPAIVKFAQRIIFGGYDSGEILWKVIERFYIRTSATTRFDHTQFGAPVVVQDGRWAAFLVRALGHSSNGPTLFQPTEGICELTAVPQYLFRAFDEPSSGQNDETVMASALSTPLAGAGRSKDDLLIRYEPETAQELFDHLNNNKYIPERGDNLVSWSSSLLFVIRYAIY